MTAIDKRKIQKTNFTLGGKYVQQSAISITGEFVNSNSICKQNSLSYESNMTKSPTPYSFIQIFIKKTFSVEVWSQGISIEPIKCFSIDLDRAFAISINRLKCPGPGGITRVGREDNSFWQHVARI